MKISHITTLSQNERDDIRLITDLCRREDRITLSCPEDGDEYWILEENGQALAYIAVYRLEETMWECYAFTRPDSRRRGFFSQLLEALCSQGESLGEPDLCFVTDNRCPAALAALQSLDAELSLEEHMMEYRITEDRDHTLIEDETDSPLALHMVPGDTVCVSAWEPGQSQAAEAAVTCRLTLNDSTAYIYSLETVPSLRRRGLASRFLAQLTALLGDTGCTLLRLQVSGANTAAMELYRKTGFRITETLSYYLY